MSTNSQRLAGLGIELPQVATPIGAYRPAVLVGDYIYTSGQLPVASGELVKRGRVGAEVLPEEAAEAAAICAQNALAAAAELAGGLDKLAEVVKITGFVASAIYFTEQAAVLNGASEFLGAVFDGVHARSAVGVAVLPLGAPVEVEAIFRIA